MQKVKLTDAQIYTLRRLATGTSYSLRGDGKKGHENREEIRTAPGSWYCSTHPVNAPSLPVLFRLGLVAFVPLREVKEATKNYRVQLTKEGQDLARYARTSDDRGDLPRGADKCPCCKVGLHWHQIHGMRLVESEGGVEFYRARCPKCGAQYQVKK